MGYPRILVIRGGAVGDFILTLPAIGALRERWPNAHVEILGYSQIVELAAGRHYAQKTRSIEYGPLSRFFVPGGELDAELSAYFASFQLVVSYLYDPDKFFENNLRRVGVKRLIVGSAKPTDLHAAAHLAKPLESLAIYVKSPQPKVHLTEEDLRFGREFLADLRSPWCAVHCGSGGETKNWPPERFAEAARWLRQNERHWNIVAVCGEADEKVTARFVEQLGAPPARLASGLRLVQIAGILSACHLYLGNDSGITHLAAAVGVPTMVFWGGSPVELWRPLGEHVRILPFGRATPENVRAEILKLTNR